MYLLESHSSAISCQYGDENESVLSELSRSAVKPSYDRSDVLAQYVCDVLINKLSSGDWCVPCGRFSEFFGKVTTIYRVCNFNVFYSVSI